MCGVICVMDVHAYVYICMCIMCVMYVYVSHVYDRYMCT